MKILVIAPHRDDEILGVGGTILKNKALGNQVSVCIVTSSLGCEMTAEQKKETDVLCEEMRKAHDFCGIDSCYSLPFRPVVLEHYSRGELNKSLLDVIRKELPDEVYIPFWGDMQLDHRLVADAAMVVMRNKYNFPIKRIYAYETLSETGINIPTAGNAFIPNTYVDISEWLDKKKEALGFYKSQVSDFPDLRSKEAVDALARLRGSTVNVKAAEAFVLVRETK